jgi:hypothetical protein
MMKKLLVLTFIFGVASFATADFVFNIDGVLYPSGSTVPISGQRAVGLYNDTAIPWYPLICWVEVDLGAEVPGSGTINNDVLPGTWTISDYGAYGGYYYWYIHDAAPSGAGTQVGNMFTVDVIPPTTLTVYEPDFATIVGTVNLFVECPLMGTSLSLSDTVFTFSGLEGGLNPADQSLTVQNLCDGTLNWSIDTAGKPDWLALTPTSGSLEIHDSNDVLLSVDITGLSGGYYNYAFDVADPNAVNSPQTVTVDLEVIGPTLGVSSNVFSFSAVDDGVNPSNKILTISNPGGGILNWSIDTAGKPDWLTISPISGSLTYTQSEPVALSVDITGLSWGQYSYAFEVSDPAAQNTPQTVTVNLEITGPPIIKLWPSDFVGFGTGQEGVNPTNQSRYIRNDGEGTLNWQITENCDWLTVTPLSGSVTTGSSAILFSVDVQGLVFEQTYQCDVLVSDPAAENSPVIVTVTLNYRESCLNELASCYNDWVAFGQPDCWCYPKQCNGNADGLYIGGGSKCGFPRAIYTADLTILANAWQVKEPPHGPGVSGTDICADFDHAAQGSDKVGYMRVSTNDLTILTNYWYIQEPPGGPGTPECPLYPAGCLNYYTEPAP